jgi:hypothetical protein
MRLFSIVHFQKQHTQFCGVAKGKATAQGEPDHLPSLAKISARFENRVSESLYFQSLERLKMAADPCVGGVLI